MNSARTIVSSSLLLLLSFSLFSQGKKAARETIWELLGTYNPDAHYMMTTLYEMPVEFTMGNMQVSLSEQTDFMNYIDRYKHLDILDEIGTAVHESCHGYESRKPYSLIASGHLPFNFEDRYSVYFVSEEEEYLVKHTNTFPSIEMAADVPGRYRTFRFDTYINTRQEFLGTQQKGIYGLMDELTAYYNGFKTLVLNFPEYQEIARKNSKMYLAYIEHAASQKVAYYEFKFYILHYLNHASIHYPEMYRELLNNEPLKLAYSAVSKAYADIISTYEENIQEIRKDVQSRGEYFRYDGETVWIGNNGIGTFSEDENVLKVAMNGIMYRRINELVSQ